MDLFLSLIEQIVIPALYIATGLLAGAPLVLKLCPCLLRVVEALVPARSWLAVITMGAAVVDFLLFTSVISAYSLIAPLWVMFTCAGLIIEVFVKNHHSRRENLGMLWAAQLLIRFRPYMGLFMIIIGILKALSVSLL